MSASLFIDNKYTRVYYTIVERAKSRILPDEVYTERHHIIPQSFYRARNKTGWLSGDHNAKKNLVNLTAKEHYICHLLLPKMLEGESKYKMLCAIIRMAYSNQEQRVKIPSRVYERVKIEKATMHSKLYSGKNNPQYGKKHSEETKEKLRKARAAQVERQGTTMTLEARAKLSVAAKGRVFSQSHKEKIAKANKGKSRSIEVRNAMSKRMTGHTKSEETLQKLRDAASNKPKKQITCPHCNKAGGEPSMRRWHLDNCKALLDK